MPVQADLQRQHTLLTQRALPHFQNTVMGTGTHNRKEKKKNFFNFMEWEVRLQALLCLATDKTKRALTWISHIFLIYHTRGTRDTNDQWVTRTDRKLLVRLDNQEWRCFLKMCTWCQVCETCILESNAIVLEKWSPCPGGLVGFPQDLDLYCWNSSRSSWSIV